MNSLSVQAFDHDRLQAMKANLAAFLRYLRGQGFHIDIESQLQAQQLLADCDFSQSVHFRLMLQTLLCSNARQWKQFDRLCRDYWLPDKLRPALKKSGIPLWQPSGELDQASTGAMEDGSARASADGGRAGKSLASRASATDANKQCDFAFIEQDSLAQRFAGSCREIARLLSRKLRKTQPAARGDWLDLRQTILQNRRYGGDLIDLVWAKKPKMLPQLTLLIDVSRSMSAYSNVFLLFALALIRELPTTRVFIFNTRLVDISGVLRANRQPQIKQYLEALNSGWGGGTRIAHSLAMLNRLGTPGKHSRRYLIIHSDGLDTDPPHALRQQLEIMQRQYRRIFWLSPLLHGAGYQVQTEALKQALPCIDRLLPAHDLNSLYNLVEQLSENRQIPVSTEVSHVS